MVRREDTFLFLLSANTVEEGQCASLSFPVQRGPGVSAAGTGLEEPSRLSPTSSRPRPSEEAERQLGTEGSQGK